MNNPTTATHVFYSKGDTNIIDTATDENPPRGHWSGETLEEIRKRYPEAIYTSFEEASAMMDAAAKLPPEEITEEKFWYMLEALPPVGWKHGADCESFKMSERWSGNITYIYARISNKYFEMRDDIRTPHDVIIEKCQTFLKEQGA